MKKVGNLYNKITLDYIYDIYYKQIRINTKNKEKIKKFEDYLSMNIIDVYNTLVNKDYKVGKYNIFLIKEPKYRIVMSQSIKDKLINHVIANILIKVLEPTLIDTNVATRINKGTHYGIKYLKKYLNELKGDTIYALKFDISKYFYSINHEILKDLLKKKIKDKYFLKNLFDIIDSTDYDVNDKIMKLKAKEISKLSDKSRINEVKKIPLYKKGYGLPIGNLSSQIMAIYYLNELDHYILEKLKVKYIRYMDDGVLLSNDKDYLKYCLVMVNRIIKKYDLKLNNKTKIINVSGEGIDFLGFHFYLLNNKLIMKVRNSSKKRFKIKMKLIKKNVISGNKALSVIASYKGHFKWGNCYCLCTESVIVRDF